MKLIHDIIIRRLDIAKDLELNSENIKALWHFYEVYKLCINILGYEYAALRQKNRLIRQLILNPDSFSAFNRIKEHMSEDNKIIEIALNTLEENEDTAEVIEDVYPPSIFGVNINDRGN